MAATSKPTVSSAPVEPAVTTARADKATDLATELAAARDRIAELEAHVETVETLGIAPVAAQESAPYFVTAVGVCYAVDGAPTNIGLALQGRVVYLVDPEAERLLLQDAVRAASEADLANEELRMVRSAAAVDAQLSGPTNNPYGGSIAGTTLERHAAEQIALAKKSGAIAGATATGPA